MSDFVNKLKLNAINAWYVNHWAFLPLLPLSWLYGIYQKRQRQKIIRADLPIWVIGNISAGGSGKTPLLMALCNYLTQKGYRVGVVSRGYGAKHQTKTPIIVSDGADPAMVGDEPCLIYQTTRALVCVCQNRMAAVLAIRQQVDVILADDGLQNTRLFRTRELLVVDSARGFGKQWLLPAGFLREPVDFDGRDVIFHDLSHQSAHDFGMRYRSNPATMTLAPKGLIWVGAGAPPNAPKPPSRVHAICAIGNPARFFATLTQMGFDVLAHAFLDHHAFCDEDLAAFDDLPIIITAKDAVKITRLGLDLPIWVLDVCADLNDEALAIFAKFAQDLPSLD